LRDAYPTIQAQAAEVVAIGTGNRRYAQHFVTERRIPYPVLLDETGEAASLASIRKGSLVDLAGPKVALRSSQAFVKGHLQGHRGSRPRQLGATFVIGPGQALHYEHLDPDAATHAPLSEVLGLLERLG